MKKFLANTIWAVGGVALALFCLSACTRELDIQQAYDFSLKVMPVQNSIAKGETAEMRCSLKRAGRFANTQSITSSLMARVAWRWIMALYSTRMTAIRSREIPSVSITLHALPTAKRLTSMWRTTSDKSSNGLLTSTMKIQASVQGVKRAEVIAHCLVLISHNSL